MALTYFCIKYLQNSLALFTVSSITCSWWKVSVHIIFSLMIYIYIFYYFKG